MEWETQLRDIIERAQMVPTFEEWVRTTGAHDLPETLGGALGLHSIATTLYARYRRTFGIK